MRRDVITVGILSPRHVHKSDVVPASVNDIGGAIFVEFA
jgi:hypothetical protein